MSDPSQLEVSAAPDRPRSFTRLTVGDRLPSMKQACAGNPGFAFDSIAGRYQLYGFFLSSQHGAAASDLKAVLARRDLFDDVHCSFTGVSVAPNDLSVHKLEDQLPGARFAWDFDHAMSRACGAVPKDSVRGEPMPVRPQWILVDPSLHVFKIFPMGETPVEEVLRAVAELPPPDLFGGLKRPAPVLILPNVFEPELCQDLIRAYDEAGGEESGVHRGGKGVVDASFKRRKDHILTDESLRARTSACISRRVVPEIERVLFMRALYIERFIVGCYAAEDGGHFSPHTDNGPGLSAHRRYAVSINLNDDFDGGEVYFPEYNNHGYKAPAGWAVVFPCGILHAVRQVTKGARYAFLPFLFDEAGRAIQAEERARAGLEP